MTDEPARYKALQRIFLSACPSSSARIFEVGEHFSYEGKPTKWMLPLNARAKAAVLKSIDPVWYETPYPAKIRRLAAQLGFEGGSTTRAAAYIESWISRETAEEETSL